MANNLCSAVESFDFDNPGDLRLILGYDKHTRIEGLCSEAAFIQDIAGSSTHAIATGYWMKQEHRGYHIYRLVAGKKSALTSLDYTVLDKLYEILPDGLLSVVYFDEATKSFYKASYTKGMHNPYAEGQPKPIDLSGCYITKPNSRQEELERLDKACNYLEAHGLLKEAAISRVFANCFLGKGNIIDIDAFTTTPTGNIGVIEVKQKFPDQTGRYGINTGQVSFFKYLHEHNIPVLHVILKKPDYQNQTINIPAIDLLTYPDNFKPSEWICTLLDVKQLRLSHVPAPAKTSIRGDKQVEYYSVDKNAFTSLKIYKEPQDAVWEKLIQHFIKANDR